VTERSIPTPAAIQPAWSNPYFVFRNPIRRCATCGRCRRGSACRYDCLCFHVVSYTRSCVIVSWLGFFKKAQSPFDVQQYRGIKLIVLQQETASAVSMTAHYDSVEVVDVRLEAH